MSLDWSDLLVAYLHEPADKALEIKGHEGRACRYAEAAGLEMRPDQLHGPEDQLASSVERLPMPSSHALVVGPHDGHLTMVHPLSGQRYELEVGPLDEAEVATVIQEITVGLDSPQKKFLALWRLLSERLAEQKPYFPLLPADTRVPDHTVWHHLDAAAGLKAALSGPRGAAMLSFALGPVQPFIEAARSVRDLWSGSMLLSWLAFHGMRPILEEYGPTAFIYPSLRGTPLVDRWLIQQGLDKVTAPSSEMMRSPCLPNRFLAVVPWESQGTSAQALAERCTEVVRNAWRDLASRVRQEIDRALKKCEGFDDWAILWDQQIEEFFSVTTTVLPLAECGDERIVRLFGEESFANVFPEAAALRGLAEAIPEKDRPAFDQSSTGRWQAQLEISARLMEACRTVRHIPPSTKHKSVPGKCSLMGTFEQMGPARLEASRKFWEAMSEHVRIGRDRVRKQERLCAVALTKRFAPRFLAAAMRIEENELRTPDTATVAAAQWLKNACENGFALDPDQIRDEHEQWSGQWLYWTRPDQDKDEEPVPKEVWQTILKARGDKRLGPPPAYYAILMMDGDHMGRWLSGEMSPLVEEVLHPEAKTYFQGLNDSRVELAFKTRRPLGPARHAAISEALGNFALHVVPKIVKEHFGTLIYAGGDDVLAMVPAAQALACARKLRRAFSGDAEANGGARNGYYKIGQRELLMMGPAATASCGLAIVHHKEDLRFALQQARRAEQAAKAAGRNALQIAVCRRSGEHTSVLCPWEFTPTAEHWVTAFVHGASDRWAYQLYGEMKTLEGLPVGAVRSELIRQVERSEKSTKDLLRIGEERSEGEDKKLSAGEALAHQFDLYLGHLRSPRFQWSEQRAMAEFALLCQTASFLARGRTH